MDLSHEFECDVDLFRPGPRDIGLSGFELILKGVQLCPRVGRDFNSDKTAGGLVHILSIRRNQLYGCPPKGDSHLLGDTHSDTGDSSYLNIQKFPQQLQRLLGGLFLDLLSGSCKLTF